MNAARPRFSYRFFFGSLALLLWAESSAGQVGRSERAGTPTDLFLIVDTSRTMIGEAGGQNIFPEVKRVLKELIEGCNRGDHVVLIPYDAEVRAQPTVVIQDDRDKQRLKRLVDGMVAKGDWTYTAAAIQEGLAEAKRLDDAQGGSKHMKVVLLLTDGLNNPPPWVRGQSGEVRLEEVARRFAGMPWFVWQVQLGPEIDQGIDRAFREQNYPNYKTVQTAAADLEKVRKQVRSELAAEQARQQAEEAAKRRREEAAAAEARRRAEEAARRAREEAERRAKLRQMLLPLGVALSVAALLGVVWVWHRQRPRPHGSLTYWRPGEPQRTCDLSSFRRLRLRVDGPGSDLVLTGFGQRGATVRAERIEGEVLCVIEADDGVTMKFRGTPVGRLELYDLDEFQLGDYSFRYRGEVSARPR